MPIWGKVLGTLFGFMVARIPGAILGFIVGHMFDKGYSQDFSQMGGFARFFTSQDKIQQQAVFFHALFSVLGHIAKADGQVKPSEIQMATQLMDQMGLSGDMRREAQQAFRDGKASDFPLKHVLKELRDSCFDRRDILQVYLEIVIQAAYVDGRLDPAEQKVLETVAMHLGFKQRELLYLMSVFEAEVRFRQRGNSQYQQRGRQQGPAYNAEQSLDDAYKILGASRSDDDSSLKKRYRKLMSEHHPDKLMPKGLPKEAMELAKGKAQDIQAAYELIKEKRGMR